MNNGKKRDYHLSPEGLRKLQETVNRTQPWKQCTGPVTEQGKARSSRNALKHGRRTEEVMIQRRNLYYLIKMHDVVTDLLSFYREVLPLSYVLDRTKDILTSCAYEDTIRILARILDLRKACQKLKHFIRSYTKSCDLDDAERAVFEAMLEKMDSLD